jgi:23S rRNA (cytosine1962-C5)-methyltransferase
VVLKPKRDRPFRQGNPWVFSGAVDRVEGEPEAGDVAELRAADGSFLGRGFINPSSQILLRVLTREDEAVDEELLQRRVSAALQLRTDLVDASGAQRLINAEGDALPGLVVDRYAEVLVVQFLTAGMDRRRGTVLELLAKRFPDASVVERSDAPSRKQEGLEPRSGVLRGEPPARVEFEEQGLRFGAEPLTGHKTGFYLDQRDNRALTRRLASGRDVLDVCAYTGGFGVAAARGGARSITSIENSASHAARIREHLDGNGFEGPSEVLTGNAFELMRETSSSFDLIVLDPPPFARSRRHVGRASRGYKDLNLLAMKSLRPGGLLLTFCCSHHVDATLFGQIVFGAAVDAGRELQILDHLGAAWDHPVSVYHQQGRYLNGLLCRAP